jgi:hypothetical protein
MSTPSKKYQTPLPDKQLRSIPASMLFCRLLHKLQRTVIIQWVAVLALKEVLDGEALLEEMMAEG